VVELLGRGRAGIRDASIPSSMVNFYALKLARVPYPTVGGIRFVLDQIAVRDSRAKAVTPESFMDLPFVKQLDHSGFIRGLYPKG
jgi:hypothetical protein